MAEKRGSIGFFSTYRPPIPLDIYSCPIPPTSKQDEVLLTDGLSYNCNAQVIPSLALKTILKRPKLTSVATPTDVDTGRVTGLIFVSERTNNLETLHIGLRFNEEKPAKVKVYNFADVYDAFKGVRMEDSGCVAGNYLIYVSTMQPNTNRRQPWTAVYKTNLRTGRTDRLTTNDQADLSPSVSPDGKKIAVATFQRKGGWHGEIENLKTDIYIMDVDSPIDPRLSRKFAIANGGWPTWGSNNILFFHRKVDGKYWAVFRADITNPQSNVPECVSPVGIDAITPSAIDANTVVVATLRQKSKLSDVRVPTQYRHIEIFDATKCRQPIQITQRTRPKADHFNPFVIVDKGGKKYVGYHRCKSDLLKAEESIDHQFEKLHSPDSNIGVFRVSGVFPSFSKDGSKLAFVDNEFKSVWVADKTGLRVIFETRGPDNVFAPVWNQNPEKDELYVCMGNSFHPNNKVIICAIPNASAGTQHRKVLTKDYNDAFPSTNPDGTKLVFRSTRAGKGEGLIYKNLYVMEDVQLGEYGGSRITRLTEGHWIDTQCHWSPRGDWIAFSSTRDKPKTAPKNDNELDPGCFAIYIVMANNPSVVVRVLTSANDVMGHVNHPIFSPDGKSMLVTADLAAVSCDPISLPVIIEHSVRPYGDIFIVDIDPNDIRKNKDVKKFTRVTHSRYENATASWTEYSTQDPKAKWNLRLTTPYTPACPYAYRDGGESWHMTGHLCIEKSCC